MENISNQTMNENESLLILNDDCIMEVFQRLALMDYANLANTCSRLRDVACDFSSRNHKKIVMGPSWESYKPADDLILSKKELSMVLSVIGRHVLEVELINNNKFLHKSIKEKCKNLKSINEHFCWNKLPILQSFRNLKQLKMHRSDINKNEWKHFFAMNAELEVLYTNYGDGFMELLTHLPKLKSLGLANIDIYKYKPRKGLDLQQLLRLTGLTKLSLESSHNLNWILIDLAKSINLVELDISMQFDGKSLGIIKSFGNLEVLSISSGRWWYDDWFSNVTLYPPRLHRFKMKLMRISCSKFLEIVQYLTFLREFELSEITWDDKSIDFKDSQAMIIETIENALILNRRQLKILWYREWNSLNLYRSNHLQIINTRIVSEEAESRRIFVDC